ncbi:MAG: hypothetical protein M1827_000405 [Pycnora praestabilis]|nr:MAG: hypothetical protein M1827_000405 [Pycnora praestabilis]
MATSIPFRSAFLGRKLLRAWMKTGSVPVRKGYYARASSSSTPFGGVAVSRERLLQVRKAIVDRSIYASLFTAYVASPAAAVEKSIQQRRRQAQLLAADYAGYHAMTTIRSYETGSRISPDINYFVDQMGYQWAILPSENNGIPPIRVGSHFDSVQSGGRFDGPLGVLTGLEVARAITAYGKKTYAPLAVINWTNEEGARFPPGCTSSAMWAGEIEIDNAHKCYDTTDHSITMGEELKRIG